MTCPIDCPVCRNPSHPNSEIPTRLVADILGQNIDADECQVAEARSIVQEAKAQLAAINNDIMCVQVVLDGLLSRRGVVTEVLASHTRLLSPIHRIPAEIFAHIFMFCLADAKSQHPSQMGVIDLPLRLSQVSRRWRSACVSYPQLWSDISISMSPTIHHGQGIRQPHIQIVQLFLERSQTMPLVLDISAPIHVSPEDIEDPAESELPENHTPAANLAVASITQGNHLYRLLSGLLRHSQRWKQAKIAIPINALSIFHKKTKHEFPLLEYLYLEDNGRTGDEQTLTAFADCPKLTTVILHIHPLTVQLPWNRITRLAIQSADDPYMNVDQILSQAVKLESLTLASYPWDVEHCSTVTVMKSLRHLDILDLDILPHIVCPQLDTLTLNQDGETIQLQEQERILHFISRSRCSIRKFRILDSDLGLIGLKSHMAEYLAAMPLLEELEVSIRYRPYSFHPTHTMEEILRDLTYPSSSSSKSAFCKHLHRISLDGGFQDGDLLAEMLRSRSTLGLPTGQVESSPIILQTARILCRDNTLSAKAREVFSQLTSAGLKLLVEEK